MVKVYIPGTTITYVIDVNYSFYSFWFKLSENAIHHQILN